MRRSSVVVGLALAVAAGVMAGGVTAVARAEPAAVWGAAAHVVAPVVAPRPAAQPAAVVPAPAPAAPRPAPAAPPAPAAKPAPAKPAGVPCAATVRACIDLAHNKAWLLRGGVVEYGPVPITSGRPGYRTPVGTFRVLSKERVHLSRAFDNAPMPYSVFFIPGIAFHQGSLSVTSHGCIHLSKAAAIRFYGSLARGDVVQAVR
ncbi:MAG TPA: L,D-transpeptidase [Pseudonocardia sp.]|jgi:L,D-transpeptidase catalytic domain|nr:L,D-transpeptidase [Pseudonocardia sp.]